MRPIWILLAAIIGVELLGQSAQGQDSGGVVKEGKRLYLSNCAVCHGQNGDGKGPAATQLTVKPRDFQGGVFKFRSTPSGSLPRDNDIDATLIRGVRGTAMVPQRHLRAAERQAVIAYLKTFSERFKREQPGAPVKVPSPPPATPTVIAQGREIYRKAQCAECHGEGGRGDGPSARTMKDDRGFPLAVPDLTQRPLKRGSEPEALFYTITTGLNGTPMPSYSDSLDPGEIWALVRYLDSLAPSKRRQPLDRLLPGEETIGQKIEEEARRASAR